jgi:signal transduction histidine kinase
MVTGHAESREWLMGPTRGPGEPANRSVTWAARLDHDVRHELGTIAMLAAAARLDPGVSAITQRRLLHIEEETRHLAAMLASALCNQPSPEVADLYAIVDEVVETYELVCTTAVDVVGCPLQALADPFSCRRAVRNLVDNALRAAGPTGHVLIELDRVNGWAVLAVHDDGAGFDAEGSSLKSLASLGLDVVGEFAERNDGHFIISNSRLGGARASIWLRPLEPESGGSAL